VYDAATNSVGLVVDGTGSPAAFSSFDWLQFQDAVERVFTSGGQGFATRFIPNPLALLPGQSIKRSGDSLEQRDSTCDNTNLSVLRSFGSEMAHLPTQRTDC
jgi:hypothetical protein